MKTPKIVAVLILLALAAGSASAFENSLPEPLEKGNFIISPLFAFGFYDPVMLISSESIMLGGDIAFDWVLPIDFPLTVGLEAGFHGAKVDYPGWDDASVSAIPIAARIGYHPNLGIEKLDVYLLGKVGWAIGFFGGKAADTCENPSGLVYGGDIGIRYFFTDRIGVVVEGGYTYYVLTYKWKAGGSNEWLGFATTYASAGVSFRL